MRLKTGGKDKMMKSTTIHEKEHGFYSKYPAKSVRQDEEARTLGSLGER